MYGDKQKSKRRENLPLTIMVIDLTHYYAHYKVVTKPKNLFKTYLLLDGKYMVDESRGYLSHIYWSLDK